MRYRIYRDTDGKYHREDGPAYVNSLIDREYWYIHGVLHRIDGPAIESLDNNSWYINGLLHRDDGPAIELLNGTKCWYINGKRHRENGPAIEYINGRVYWYLNDQVFYFEEWLELTPISIEEKILLKLRYG